MSGCRLLHRDVLHCATHDQPAVCPHACPAAGACPSRAPSRTAACRSPDAALAAALLELREVAP